MQVTLGRSMAGSTDRYKHFRGFRFGFISIEIQKRSVNVPAISARPHRYACAAERPHEETGTLVLLFGLDSVYLFGMVVP